MDKQTQEIQEMLEDLSSGKWLAKITNLGDDSLHSKFLGEILEQAGIISDVYWEMYHAKEYTTKHAETLLEALMEFESILDRQQKIN